MFGVVWDYYSSKLKGKQYKQNTSLESYKTEAEILANPGLASSSFEQLRPGLNDVIFWKEILSCWSVSSPRISNFICDTFLVPCPVNISKEKRKQTSKGKLKWFKRVEKGMKHCISLHVLSGFDLT